MTVALISGITPRIVLARGIDSEVVAFFAAASASSFPGMFRNPLNGYSSGAEVQLAFQAVDNWAISLERVA